MTPRLALLVVVILAGVTRIEAQGHAKSEAPKSAREPKDSHAPKGAHAEQDEHAATPAHAKHASTAAKESRAAQPPAADRHAETPATHHASPDATRHSEPSAASHGKDLGAVQPAASATDRRRAPNPALEAVLQRINRRISTAKPDGGASAKTPRAAAATTPTFRLKVTAAPEPQTPPVARVHLAWRPTVIWPAAVRPHGDEDARVQLDWSR